MNRQRIAVIFAALCTFATIAVVLGVRWFGPHDLYEKDQPKTMAYTADVVLHGRFALPRDVIYQPATKPPLYNWLDAAVIKSTGVWTEWTLKFPSVFGVVATGAIVFAMAWRATRNTEGASPLVVGLLALGIWFSFGSDVRHGSVLRLSYLARPDMLLTAAMTGAWACFTLAVERPTTRAAWRWAIGGWLCVTAAALTKGPAALIPAAFALLQPMLSPTAAGRTASRYARLWLPVGLPVVIVGVGAWLACAAKQDATHVRTVIWGAEVAGRIMEKSPEGFTSDVHLSAMWFVTKAQPWGAIAAGALLATALVPRLRRAAGAPALYLLIVLIGLTLPAGKRMDYLLPAYAPAAVLIAVVLADFVRFRVVGAAAVVGLIGVAIDEAVLLALRMNAAKPSGRVDITLLAVLAVIAGGALLVERRRRLPLAAFTAVPLLLACLLGRAFLNKFHESKGRWSDAAVAFVDQVRRRVRPDQNLVVVVRGKHPLTTLLGRHPGSYLTPRDLAAAEYVIIPQQPDLPAELLSKPLPTGFAQIEERPLEVLGLYRRVPLDRLVALQRAAGVWSEIENPYHAPGTVFRDD